LGSRGHLDDFASNQFVFDPIPVLVDFLGHRQELIGREEGGRRHVFILARRAQRPEHAQEDRVRKWRIGADG